jgi:hypothetical protein
MSFQNHVIVYCCFSVKLLYHKISQNFRTSRKEESEEMKRQKVTGRKNGEIREAK